MLSITVFILLLGLFFGVVWYAVAHEDVVTSPDKPRLGALSRALGRVRKFRSSRRAAACDHRSDQEAAASTVVSSSAHTSSDAPLPPPA